MTARPLYVYDPDRPFYVDFPFKLSEAEKQPSQFIDRSFLHNREMNDGTPRCEKGWRSVLEYEYPKSHRPRAARIFVTSPLFSTKAAAEAWWPEQTPRREDEP